MRKIFLLCLILIIPSLEAKKISIDKLYESLEISNPDLKLIKLKNKFAEEQVTQARSGYYPQVSSSWVINEGKEGDPLNAASLSTSGSGSLSGIPSASSSNSTMGSQDVSQDGWSGDVTMTMPIFNRFSVQTSLKNSKLNLKKSGMEVDQELIKKRNQLLQLILEINSLKEIRRTITEAQDLSMKGKSSRGRKNKALYSESEDLKNIEFTSEIDYQAKKVELAYSLAISAFYDLIPTAEKNWIERLPNISVNFEYESPRQLKETFLEKNTSLQMTELEVQSYKNVYHQSQWEKPWVPQFFLTGSFNKNRDWEGRLNDEESWRISAVVSFNLFDGYYTKARRSQAHLSYLMAEEYKKSSRSKNLINLERHYRQAELAKARHRYMLAKAKRTEQKLKSIKQVASSGVSMKRELSGLLLKLTKEKWEAMDEHKKYQQHLLSLAELTNQMHKVGLVYE